MKLFTQLIVILIATISTFAQTSPKIILNDDTELKLSKLYVNAELHGQYASVTYDMTFYNGLNRVLEGELSFPLAQGQTVSNLAMDLNGQLRNAVIVEKELGRVAYENTIRQRIDPALLEQTKGNNYKVRVYPIPANGYKRVVITYEENLPVNAGNYTFTIPFDFKDKIDEFKLDVTQNSNESQPQISGFYKNKLVFKTNNKSFKSAFQDQSIVVNKPLSLSIPVVKGVSLATEDDYFFLNTSIKGKSRPKSQPKIIDLFWDASYSMLYKNKTKELELLDKYIKNLDKVKINLIIFSNTIIEKQSYNISNGQWSQLKFMLQNVIYDGGTSFKILPSSEADEVILVSDGMHNLGELQLHKNSRLYAINSVKSANHQYLENNTNTAGGNYINLNREAINSALLKLINEPFQFIGIKGNNRVFEVYPKANTTITESFVLGGKFFNTDTFEMQFGYNGKVTQIITVDFSKASNSNMAKRLWAKLKLKHLLADKANQKEAIISLCKDNHLISEYTSMIVLDRIEDYVRYRIEPPKEFLAEYKRQLSNLKELETARDEDIKDRKKELKDDYKKLQEWYKKDFTVKKDKSKPQQNTNTTTQVSSTTATTENNVASTRITNNLDTSKPIVRGVITDSEGLTLPGVNIIVKGTSVGAITDFDGLYAINANVNDVLIFSFVGLKTTERTVTDTASSLNVSMAEDDSRLEEVVVTGYAAPARRKIMSASVSIVNEEIIEPNASLAQTLNGQVLGVTITDNSGQAGNSSVVRLRGVNTLNGNGQPLFVVDGKPVAESNFKALLPDQIASVTTLKDAGATAIYGNRGANGVVVITTKQGLETNNLEINKLNSKIEDVSKLQPWQKNASYLQLLEAQKTISEAYAMYLELRVKFNNTPSFFLDVAEFFESKANYIYAFRIISNLIEIDIDNHELIRALGYKLTQYNKNETAVYVFEEVLKLRPEEPQSYRDLALAYAANGQKTLAFDFLQKIVKGELLHKDIDEKYYGIETIAYNELRHLVNSDKVFKDYRKDFPVIETDIRVVIDWNHDNTDLDLHVINPAGDEIYYSKSKSKYGGRLSEDMTEGYGPETFMLKKAQHGTYKIRVKYFSDNVQKIIGPTNLKVTIIENYGRKNETQDIKVYRLENEDGMLEAGSIKI